MSKATVFGITPQAVGILSAVLPGPTIYSHDLDHIDHPHFEVNFIGPETQHARIKATYVHPDFSYEVMSSDGFVTSVGMGTTGLNEARVIGNIKKAQCFLYAYERLVEELQPSEDN